MTKDKPSQRADRPMADGERQYHLQTRRGDLSRLCLLVGSPERAEAIARDVFTDAHEVGNHRGLKSFTGTFGTQRMSVVTTGMGGASIGIVLPEAAACGAEIFIRVGTCSSLKADVSIGSLVICTGAVRLDGASENWAPIEYPAVADYRVVGALVQAAIKNDSEFSVGIGITTSCFNEGQARPDERGYLSERHKQRHDELMRCGALFYSMEEAALFTWCLTHGNIPVGSVCAVIGNRITNKFCVCGEMEAAQIAAQALTMF